MQQLFRILLSACLLLILPAGAGALESQPVRDIRKIVVSGGAGVPAAVIKRAGEHLRSAARATRRPVRLDRAQMDVHVARVTFGADGRHSAQVEINLSGLEGGAAAARRSVTVNSFMPQSRGRDAALAEAIARRVALAYNLAPVKVAKAKIRKQRRTAARSSVQAYSGADKRPLVIPTEAALTVRSRALPAGSKRKVAPCVVTRTVSCD